MQVARISEQLVVALNERTQPDDVIRAYGKCIGAATAAVDLVHEYVTWLRSKQYRICDEAEMTRVKGILQSGFRGASDNVLSTYARTLRSLLSCDVLPAKFSLTNSVQVGSFELHDEVDGLFPTQKHVDGKSTSVNEWWTGLVVNKRAATTAEPYEVFWMGYKPCKSGRNRNPTWMSVHSLRRHIDGTAVGSDAYWLDVEKVKTLKIEPWVRKPKPLPKPSLKPSVVDRLRRSKKPKPQEEEEQPQQEEEEEEEEKEEEEEDEENEDEEENEEEEEEKKEEEEEEEEQEEEEQDEEEEDKDEQEEEEQEQEQELEEDEEQEQEQEEDESLVYDDPQCQYQAMLKVFNDVEKAIETLRCLHMGLSVHQSLFDDLSAILMTIAKFQAGHYSNSAYVTLASKTLDELAAYQGEEEPKLPHTREFVKKFSKFGFCITPRLWKKEEIVCIAIALLDPRLKFSGIMQKDGKNVQNAFRGMAVLDPRIQRVFYERLRSFGFVNPRYHPERLQSFSSVVINGGGSWQQNSTWEFPLCSRFQINPEAVPFMIKVATEGVGALEAYGVYVATTTIRNGKHVYVQVSKQEFDGFQEPRVGTQPGLKQLGLKTCINPLLCKKIRNYCQNYQGNRLDPCSPRVLSFMDNSKWGIQLLPAYGSDFFIFELEWPSEQTCNIEASAFAYLDFDNFQAEWQKCCVSLEVLYSRSNEVLIQNQDHRFSFGPIKVSKCNLTDKKMQKAPAPLGPQGFHSDGPLRFNCHVFSNLGALNSNAPSCSRRRPGQWIDLWDNPLTEFLPQHINIMEESFSALFGIFSGTYIQTPASEDSKRKDSVLNVNIPLGCAIVFTFAWKHRGKGDDGHEVTKEAPVAVHARPHFYCFSSDLRRFPTIDFEACLEFLSVCAQTQLDSGSGLFALDTLQTFDATSAPGHWKAKDVHPFFKTQSDLNSYIIDQLGEQRAQNKVAVRTVCEDWMLKLHWVPDGTCSLAIWHRNGQDDARVDVVSACFDSDQPTLLDSQGERYILVGEPRKLSEFPADTPDAVMFKTQFETTLLPIAQNLMSSLVTYWKQSFLLYLLNILNAYAIVNSNIDGLGDDAVESLELDHKLKGYFHRPGLNRNAVEISHFTPVSEWVKSGLVGSHGSCGFFNPAYWIDQGKCIIMPLCYPAGNPDAIVVESSNAAAQVLLALNPTATGSKQNPTIVASPPSQTAAAESRKRGARSNARR